MSEIPGKILQHLGTGAYGDVYEVDIGGEVEAFKFIRSKHDFITSPNEFDIMNRVSNKYVICATGVYFPSAINFGGMGILMPLARAISSEIVHEPNFQRSFIRKTAEGINALHRNGILHLDIKPANVLIFDNELEYQGKTYHVPEPKIIDFGLSRVVRSVQDGQYVDTPGGVVGTITYQAPEHFNQYYSRGSQKVGKLLKQCIYRDKSDVWSFGILAYHLFLGDDFFPVHMRVAGYNRDEIFEFLRKNLKDEATRRRFLEKRVTRSNRVETKYKKRLVELLVQTLEWDWRKRLTLDQIIRHPVFDNIVTPLSETYMLTPEWPPEDYNPSNTFPKKCVETTLQILKHRLFHPMDIFVLFHAVDIVYRYAVTRECSNETDLAAVAVNIAIKYRGYSILTYNYIASILPSFKISEARSKHLTRLEENIYENFSLVVYRRWLYDHAHSFAHLIKLYRTYILNPEKYYQFDPVSSPTTGNSDPFFAHKTIGEMVW